jgi:hypothetical protein
MIRAQPFSESRQLPSQLFQRFLSLAERDQTAKLEEFSALRYDEQVGGLWPVFA